MRDQNQTGTVQQAMIDPDNLPPCPETTRLYSWHLDKMKVGDEVGIQKSSYPQKYAIVKITKISRSGQITTEGGWRFTKNGEEIGNTYGQKKALWSVEYCKYSNIHAQAAEMRSHRVEEIRAICNRILTHAATWRMSYAQLSELRHKLVEIDELIQQQAYEQEARLQKEKQDRKRELAEYKKAREEKETQQTQV